MTTDELNAIGRRAASGFNCPREVLMLDCINLIVEVHKLKAQIVEDRIKKCTEDFIRRAKADSHFAN
jgi:hypothetical protein